MNKGEIFFLTEESIKDGVAFSPWYIKDIFKNNENKKIYIISRLDTNTSEEKLIRGEVEDYFNENKIITVNSFKKIKEKNILKV